MNSIALGASNPYLSQNYRDYTSDSADAAPSSTPMDVPSFGGKSNRRFELPEQMERARQERAAKEAQAAEQARQDNERKRREDDERSGDERKRSDKIERAKRFKENASKKNKKRQSPDEVERIDQRSTDLVSGYKQKASKRRPRR